MRLNLRQIEVFRAIMITGSISGAAKYLHVSQPGISRLIAYTENRLGLKLFDRVKGRLYATPEARSLFAELESVFEGLQRVNDFAQDLVENKTGVLRIVCSPSLGLSLIPRAAALFYQRHPDARLIVKTMLPDTMVHSLLTQQVEVGIVFLQESHPNLQSQLLYDNKMVVVMPPDHPLSERGTLTVADLCGYPFIGYSSDIPMGRAIRELFSETEVMPRMKAEVQQVHMACAMVHAGLGLALVDELTMSDPIWSSSLAVRPLIPTVTLPVSALHLAHSPLSRLAQEFVGLLASLAP
ncbi:LysR family transcriptional regulator [Pandoraea anhela]|uniref:HTH-type transcriptional regulator BenM n=1 Tax=Pandoraea anhela TaxID=2508295 RepID=A0A5E4WDV2_9BURK|nr:LysR family transcriptional regulator [Pandoraea anhela]VVE22591.1 HTH-type transcriptional regulator BenM [Pandoraea anhela]